MEGESRHLSKSPLPCLRFGTLLWLLRSQAPLWLKSWPLLTSTNIASNFAINLSLLHSFRTASASAGASNQAMTLSLSCSLNCVCVECV